MPFSLIMSPSSRTIPIDRETVRMLFRVWESSMRLGELPLAQRPFVDQQRSAQGYRNSPAGRGLALRELIREEIDRLRPAVDPPDFTQKRWRPYIILMEQFVNGRSPKWVAAQLHIAKRTYHKEQRRALELLADRLARMQQASPASVLQEKVFPTPFLAPPPTQRPFIGRDDMFTQVKDQLLPEPAHPIAFSGLPGVGKSSLLQELAHDPQIRQRFPDGVLWAGLGQTPDLFGTLGRWGQALGLSRERLLNAPTIKERVQLLHDLLGERAVLLCIDDAWESRPALTLRLGGARCGHLLTTRLTGIAFDFAGENFVALPELSTEESRVYFERTLRPAPEKQLLLDELGQRVGGLPLALHLISRLILNKGWWHAQQLLEDPQRRLQLERPLSPLAQPDGAAWQQSISLFNTIAFSLATLTAVERSALAGLALFPAKPNSFGRDMALAFLQSDSQALEALEAAGLVEEMAPGRLALHQTIRDYARQLRPSEEQTARFGEVQLRFAQENAAAYARLEKEWENLLAGITTACAEQNIPQLTQLLAALDDYLVSNGRYAQVVPLLDTLRKNPQVSFPSELTYFHAHGLHAIGETLAARTVLDGSNRPMPTGSPQALYTQLLWGEIHLRLGELDTALKIYQTLLSTTDTEKQPVVCLKAAQMLAATLSHLGRFAESEAALTQAQQIAESQNNQTALATTLDHFANLKWRQGKHAQSIAALEQSIPIHQALGSQRNEMIAWLNWVASLSPQAAFFDGPPTLKRILALCRANHFHQNEVYILSNLGNAHSARGLFEAAEDYLVQGQALAVRLGHRRGEASCLIMRGRSRFREGGLEAAIPILEEAHVIAKEIEETYYQNEILVLLGHIYRELNELNMAQTVYGQAQAALAAVPHASMQFELGLGQALLQLERGAAPLLPDSFDTWIEELSHSETLAFAEPARVLWMGQTLCQRLGDARWEPIAIRLEAELEAVAAHLPAAQRQPFLLGMRFHHLLTKLRDAKQPSGALPYSQM